MIYNQFVMANKIDLFKYVFKKTTPVLIGYFFLGIGFFHILPEATENFENYFLNEGKDSYIKGWPIVYLLAFLSYSLILYIEKVAFNSHALIAHTHGEGHNSDEENLDDDLKEPLLAGNNDNKEGKKIYHDCTNDLFEDDNKEDELYFRDKNNERDDEQIIRNIISSKGQFSSVLQSRNLSKY